MTRIIGFADDDGWFWRCDVDDVAYGLAVFATSGKQPRTTLVLGRTGAFVRLPAGQEPDESQVPFDNDDFWTDLVVAGKIAYACGTRRAVAQFAKGTWKRIDAGIRVEDDDEVDADWSAASVAADGSLVVCGDGGAVYRWHRKAWTNLAAPTHMSLSAVTCLADGSIVVGSDGIVFVRAADGSWTEITLDTDDAVEVILETPHGVLLLTMHEMLRLVGQVAQPVLSAADFKIEFADFDCIGKFVWIVGGGLAIRWDGKKSKPYLCTENL